MSRRNREKRAAKHKNRRRAKDERAGFDPGPDRALIVESLVVALSTAASGAAEQVPRRAAELLRECRAFARELAVAADLAMNEAIRAAWEHGWQPSDLHEIAGRRLKPAEVRYLDEAIVLESRQYATATLHPAWRADIAGLSATVGARTQPPQMWRWAASNAADRCEALTVVLKLLNLLGRLPVLEVIVPLPGAYRHTATVVSDAGEKALGRVRALLAKAEATEFPDEAEALSAKAQDLMSRFSLKDALAQHDRGRKPAAAARRIWIDNPYVAAKATLVQVVSGCNRCRAVWAERLGFVTVIGCETDLNLVELLTTSLLVQANRAMLSAGRGGGAQARSRSFRHSFYVAYAQRIGERLDSASASVSAEVEREARLLPVLAANSRATEELTQRLFPSTVPRAVAVSNGAGWGAGRAAANMAVLDARDSIAG
ncbi:DUF2786 domain-containing protein [Mycobacterium celatum]|uniref:DUF2786 domain-containing protein n=1 Tax=Mycobacterium celatum TaxID=28045 RepID=A0A1X1RP11_MYCCE|nr:DUF2786 domain-containing protein [Mycobacterium celatum]ORV10686.1 hypothetical protein AWB95_14910 [Mycobacterium celatum]PIB78730.1 DUF2786 domain-containing protein [Mycobacterium celatum]